MKRYRAYFVAYDQTALGHTHTEGVEQNQISATQQFQDSKM